MSLRTPNDMQEEGYKAYFEGEKNDYIGWAAEEFSKGYMTAKADALAVKSQIGVWWILARLQKCGASEATLQKVKDRLMSRIGVSLK